MSAMPCFKRPIPLIFLKKKRVINNEIVPQYYAENSHEAIIPKDLHMQVQEEITRRANLYNGKNGSCPEGSPVLK